MAVGPVHKKNAYRNGIIENRNKMKIYEIHMNYRRKKISYFIESINYK